MGKAQPMKPVNAADKPFSFTMQGIWQPSDPNAVRQEMMGFSACVR